MFKASDMLGVSAFPESLNHELSHWCYEINSSSCDGNSSSCIKRKECDGRQLRKDSVLSCESAHRKIRLIPFGKGIHDYYYVGETLGVCNHNSNSSRPLLKEAIDIVTYEPRIVKIIKKSRIPVSAGGERLWRRLCEKLLAMDAHPNVMRVYDILESPESFFIVTEKFHGGELFDLLLNECAIPEHVCQHITRQILRAVSHLHMHCLLHRDIKPENLMFCWDKTGKFGNTRDKHRLSLIDFDTCKMMDVEPSEYGEVVNGKRRLIGTYGYLAPEVLQGAEYSCASDLWSVGVIVYILMTGIPPIPMDKMNSARESLEILLQVEANGIDFNQPPLLQFSQARDLCMQLLQFNPRCRMKSALTALDHPWLTERRQRVSVDSLKPRCLQMPPPSPSAFWESTDNGSLTPSTCAPTPSSFASRSACHPSNNRLCRYGTSVRIPSICLPQSLVGLDADSWCYDPSSPSKRHDLWRHGGEQCDSCLVRSPIYGEGIACNQNYEETQEKSIQPFDNSSCVQECCEKAVADSGILSNKPCEKKETSTGRSGVFLKCFPRGGSLMFGFLGISQGVKRETNG